MGTHAAVAAELLGDRAMVDAVLNDHRSAKISDADTALFTFLEQVVRDPTEVTQHDVDRVTSSGWSDEAVYDAVTVCGVFKLVNTWVDALGEDDMPREFYEQAGARMAHGGYCREHKPDKGVPDAGPNHR